MSLVDYSYDMHKLSTTIISIDVLMLPALEKTTTVTVPV